MYYSSEEYIEPDVVVIFGNDYEMLKVQNKDESIHSGRTSLKIQAVSKYQWSLDSYKYLFIY